MPAHDPERISYGRRLAALAAAHGDEDAVIFARRDRTEQTVSWAALDQRANQMARLLTSKGVGRGDVVVVALGNSPEHLVATFGSWKVGASVLPLRWDLPTWERNRLLAVAVPRLVVADWPRSSDAAITPEDMARLQELPDEPPAQDFVAPYTRLIATSGATGVPKIVVAPSPAVFVAGERLPVLGDTSGKTVLAASPLYHINGFTFGAYTPLLQDSRIVLMERFDAAHAVELIERHRVAFTVMVPTMLQRIARLDDIEPRDLASLERVVYGGAMIPEWVVRRWLELVEPGRFALSYGGTEGYGTVATTGTAWLEHPGTCGTPINCEVRITDENGEELPIGEVGEIFLRSHSDTPRFRYLGLDDPEPDPDGWGSFGDMGHVDDDGFLYIADRRRDLIVSGGANVFPAEVETALSEHAGLADSVVVGLPDPEWGHRVHAIVEPVDDRARPREADLREHCRARLAAYKVPKTFEVVDTIPRSAAGKVNRSALVAERVQEEHQSESTVAEQT